MIKPLHDYVLIEPDSPPKQIGNIHLPESSDPPTTGKVIDLGGGPYSDKDRCVFVKIWAGCQVLFNRYGSTEVEVDGKRLCLVRYSDIMAVEKDADYVANLKYMATDGMGRPLYM